MINLQMLAALTADRLETVALALDTLRPSDRHSMSRKRKANSRCTHSFIGGETLPPWRSRVKLGHSKFWPNSGTQICHRGTWGMMCRSISAVCDHLPADRQETN